MEKIFYTDKRNYASSEQAIRQILTDCFGIRDARISRTETGKPFLVGADLFFSVSHTENALFIAFSDKNVGLDVERLNRQTDYQKILKKFPEEERAVVRSQTDFLRLWTVKESAVKWLGGSLLHDLRHLRYLKGEIFYKNIPLPVHIAFPSFQDYVLAVCAENDFSNVSVTII